jgi:hypothetical protein
VFFFDLRKKDKSNLMSASFAPQPRQLTHHPGLRCHKKTPSMFTTTRVKAAVPYAVVSTTKRSQSHSASLLSSWLLHSVIPCADPPLLASPLFDATAPRCQVCEADGSTFLYTDHYLVHK